MNLYIDSVAFTSCWSIDYCITRFTCRSGSYNIWNRKVFVSFISIHSNTFETIQSLSIVCVSSFCFAYMLAIVIKVCNTCCYLGFFLFAFFIFIQFPFTAVLSLLSFSICNGILWDFITCYLFMKMTQKIYTHRMHVVITWSTRQCSA